MIDVGSDKHFFEAYDQRGIVGEINFLLDACEEEGADEHLAHIWCVGFTAFFKKKETGEGRWIWEVRYEVDDYDGSHRLGWDEIETLIEQVRAIECVVAFRNARNAIMLPHFDGKEDKRLNMESPEVLEKYRKAEDD